MEKDTSIIPHGMYCYRIIDIKIGKDGMPIEKTMNCPYRYSVPNKPYQESAYCAYIGKGAWEEDGPWLIGDCIKCCGINLEDEDGETIEEKP